MSSSGVEKGLIARSSRLLGMAARVARHELAHEVGRRVARSADALGATSVALRVRQARVVAEHLAQLKGAAMKAGQFLSIDAADLLPPEALEVLARLHSDAEPVPLGTIEGVLVAELGAAGLARLEGLDERPAAAASIGQVHAARVDGRRVAVKVQYPDIAESIPSDLAVVRGLASSWLTLSGRRWPLEEVFEELRAILELEADYRHEAACMERYRASLDGDARYTVPEALLDLSTSRVLTMTWLDGQPLGGWLAGRPPAEARRQVAVALLDLYCREFFEWGFVQTDPNPGNFLVRGDGGLGLLDFGATLTYDEAFRREYVELLGVLTQPDPDAVIEGGIAFGLLDPREGAEARRRFGEMMRIASRPFSPELQPFVFRDADYQREARDVVRSFVQELRFTAPPRRLLFLHRKLGGLFNILKRLDVSLDLTPYWERMVGSSSR